MSPSFENLVETARRIRRHLVKMSHAGKAPHLGSALSTVEILVSLYWNVADISPETSSHSNRDRVILSKGHAAAALYATLAERGFIPVSQLATYAKSGSSLPEQMSPNCIPGVEAATGSLGHGLPMGLGMALAGKIQNQNYRTWVIMSDGECNEGSVWEAAMTAPAFQLNRVTVIVDYNGWQATGRSDKTLNLAPLTDKWKAFGWAVTETDGHDHSQLITAMQQGFQNNEKPTAIIAKTTKGRGISFMEDDNNWHYRIPDSTELENALAELGES